MLGRLLLSTSILVIITLSIATYSQSRFSASAQLSTDRLRTQINTNHQIVNLRNLLWEIETQFQSYMLQPEEELRLTTLETIEHAMMELSVLKLTPWIKSHKVAAKTVHEFDQKIHALKDQVAEIMIIRADPIKVFPSMTILVNHMNPANQSMNNRISLAINESDDLQGEPGQDEIKATFNEIRYLWLQKINSFRILIGSRVGIFQSSLQQSIRSTTSDIEIYNRRLLTLLKKLDSLNSQSLLGLQQSESLELIKSTNREWNNYYKQALTFIKHNDAWRIDTPMVRDQITPLFLSLWSELEMIDRILLERAKQDLHLNKQTSEQVSYSLWLLALVVLGISIASTLLFEVQIRRPIIRISTALNEEAQGKAHSPLPVSPVTETRQLIDAFSYMRQQVSIRQEHLQAVLTYAADAIITTDPAGTIKSFNPAAEQLFEYRAEQAVGQSLQHFIDDYTMIRETSLGKERESMAINFAGSRFPVAVRISKMRVGEDDLFLVMVNDIRERRAMLEGIQAREQRLLSILDNTAEAIVTFDEYGHIENWNLAAEQLFGWEEKEVIGSIFTQFIASETIQFDSVRVNRELLKHFIGKETEVIGEHKNGHRFPLSLKIGKMTLEGKPKYTALLANIAERKAMMENLRHLAEHDSLTGLYNRAYFHEYLNKLVSTFQPDKTSMALLYIDLDNFKYINDTLGHLAGDKLLIEVSELLNMRARRSDLVARLGGDEFVLLIHEVNATSAQPIADSYRKLLVDYQFNFEGKSVDVGCSIGVALLDKAELSPAEILSRADFACHLAKRAGRNRVHIFAPKDEGDVTTMSLDMGWSRRIREALEHDRFVLAAQPIVETQSKEIFLYEILVRMLDEDGSIIMPSGFLPTAERFGLSVEIDLWIIEHAMRQLAELHTSNPQIRFSINLSGQSMSVPAIAEKITHLLLETKLDPTSLTFEVTETVAISEMDTAVKLLKRLSELGCHTALDDFGSGMSSFAYLQELPVDIVKIDGRFVRNIAESTVDQAMVKAMNDIAHALGKKTVAEFVENEHHLQTLRSIKVDYSQGYHLGKPELLENISASYLHNRAKSRSA